jgi:hypothetical protein
VTSQAEFNSKRVFAGRFKPKKMRGLIFFVDEISEWKERQSRNVAEKDE